MQGFDSAIESHYTREGLFETVVQRLEESGIEFPERKDISGLDEFHVRGAAVSLELAKEAGFNKKSRVLDVGCGLGGPCRMIAAEFGSQVTGIDLTAEFVRSARLLTEMVGLKPKINFLQANALDLPFENGAFDFVWTQHVQMNIHNKQKFYSEINRVLDEGGKFIYYDIFIRNHEPLLYPLPWAGDPSMSHLFSTAEFENIMLDAEMVKVKVTDQTGSAIRFFKEMFERLSREGPPKIGLDLLLGPTAKEKFGNLYKNILEGRLELQSGIYQKN